MLLTGFWAASRTGSAVCLDIQPKQSIFFIEDLGMETALSGIDCQLNDKINLKVSKIDIPNLEVVFAAV